VVAASRYYKKAVTGGNLPMSNDSIDFGFLAGEVVKRLDILEEAEKEGLCLRRKGKNYFTLCPFHSERTPSFSICPNKRMFHCFSCGKGGNVIHLMAALRNVSKGKVIYQYARALGLLPNRKINQPLRQEMKHRAIKYEFKKKEENHFDEVYRFLCNQIHAFRKSMKQVKTLEERNALQEFYQIYDKLPYYEYLVECIDGQHGEQTQVEAYFFEGKKVMNEWISRVNR
jgi:hypothetical protein